MQTTGIFRHLRKFKVLFKAIVLLMNCSILFPAISWSFESTSFQSKLTLPISVQHGGRDITIPEKFGTILSHYQGKKKTVICIEDLHCHYEVQKNIANIIDELSRKHKLELVGEEGAFGSVDTSVLKTYPDKKIRNATSDFFVKQGKLTGVEHASITLDRPVYIEGIENRAMYHASQDAIEHFLNAESQGICYDVMDMLQAIKYKVYNKDLQAFDKQVMDYEEGRLDLLTFATLLEKIAHQRALDTSAFNHIKSWLASAATRQKQTIDQDLLYTEVTQLEKAIRSTLYDNGAQQALDNKIDQLKLIERLLSISVTQQELDTFRTNRNHYQTKAFSDFIKLYDDAAWLDSDAYTLDTYLDSVETFYQLADKRSQAFVDCFVQKMDDHNQTLGLMVSGGFHSDKVLQALRQKNVSYVLVRPQLSRLDIVNPYFSLLQGKPLPLEKLLEQNQTIMALPVWPETEQFKSVVAMTLSPVAKAQLPTMKGEIKQALETYLSTNQIIELRVLPNKEKEVIAQTLPPECTVFKAIVRGSQTDITVLVAKDIKRSGMTGAVDVKAIENWTIAVFENQSDLMVAIEKMNRRNAPLLLSNILAPFLEWPITIAISIASLLGFKNWEEQFARWHGVSKEERILELMQKLTSQTPTALFSSLVVGLGVGFTFLIVNQNIQEALQFGTIAAVSVLGLHHIIPHLRFNLSSPQYSANLLDTAKDDGSSLHLDKAREDSISALRQLLSDPEQVDIRYQTILHEYGLDQGAGRYESKISDKADQWSLDDIQDLFVNHSTMVTSIEKGYFELSEEFYDLYKQSVIDVGVLHSKFKSRMMRVLFEREKEDWDVALLAMLISYYKEEPLVQINQVVTYFIDILQERLSLLDRNFLAYLMRHWPNNESMTENMFEVFYKSQLDQSGVKVDDDQRVYIFDALVMMFKATGFIQDQVASDSSLIKNRKNKKTMHPAFKGRTSKLGQRLNKVFSIFWDIALLIVSVSTATWFVMQWIQGSGTMVGSENLALLWLAFPVRQLKTVFDFSENQPVQVEGDRLVLKTLLGPGKTNEAIFKKHMIGDVVYHFKDRIFGKNFDLLNQIQVKLGAQFAVGYLEKEGLSKDLDKDLKTQDVVFTISLPRSYGFVLGSKPDKGWIPKMLYQIQTAIARQVIRAKLRDYTTETSMMILESAKEKELLEQDYNGQELKQIPVHRLAGLGGKMLNEAFYRPKGNQQVGITGAEIGKVIEAIRQNMGTAQTMPTLWQIIQPKLTELLASGHVPSTATLIEALRQQDVKGITEPSIRNHVIQLQQTLVHLKQKNDPVRMEIEVNQIADLLVRSKKGLDLQMMMPAKEAIQNTGDQITFLMDKKSRIFARGAVFYLKECDPDRETRKTLNFLQSILLKETLTTNETSKFQALLQQMSMAASHLTTAVIGEDVSKFGGIGSNGRIEILSVKMNSSQLQVAKPVIMNVMANKAATIESIGTDKRLLEQEVTIIPFEGRLPVALNERGNFAKDMSSVLENVQLFKNALHTSKPLAQAYYRWHGKKSAVNNRRMVRVLVRMLKQQARQLDTMPAKQKDYDQALVTASQMFKSSRVFKTAELGEVEGQPVYIPTSLRRGGQLAFIFLWSKQSGDFILNDRLEDQIRRERLKNFRMSSAA